MSRTKNPNTRTRWFSRTLPSLPGVYEVEDKNICSDTVRRFAYWDGAEFKRRALTKDVAADVSNLVSMYGPRPLRWRGLKHQPATHPAPAKDYTHDNQFALAA